jgi:hypothetical protein
MTKSKVALQMTWDKVCDIMQQCKHPGEIGWKIAKLIKINNFRVWERAIDVKIGMNLIVILKQAVSLRKRPQFVLFDRQGNVTAKWD